MRFITGIERKQFILHSKAVENKQNGSKYVVYAVEIQQSRIRIIYKYYYFNVLLNKMKISTMKWKKTITFKQMMKIFLFNSRPYFRITIVY